MDAREQIMREARWPTNPPEGPFSEQMPMPEDPSTMPLPGQMLQPRGPAERKGGPRMSNDEGYAIGSSELREDLTSPSFAVGYGAHLAQQRRGSIVIGRGAKATKDGQTVIGPLVIEPDGTVNWPRDVPLEEITEAIREAIAAMRQLLLGQMHSHLQILEHRVEKLEAVARAAKPFVWSRRYAGQPTELINPQVTVGEMHALYDAFAELEYRVSGEDAGGEGT